MACNMTPVSVNLDNWIAGGDGKVRGSDPLGLVGGGGDSAVAFKSFVYEANTANTTIDIVVERHPDLSLNLSGAAVATVTATDGFNSNGRYTALSEDITWLAGDVSDKTVQLTVPAQTLDGPFEVNLDLTPVSGCSVRKWEEGAALARVDDGSVYSLAYHVSPDDVNARDEPDAGTAAKPALSGYYLFQDIIFRTHPDVNKPVMIYFHAGNHTDSGPISWSSVREGYYPEIDGTREHPIKIQNYPGDTVSLANSVGFLIEDRKHLHIKGIDTGSHNNYVDYWTGKPEYLLFEDMTVSGFRSATGATNHAGFRIDWAGKSVIRNCNISDFKLDSGDYNGNLACILSYRSHNILIENCDLDDASAGIYHKVPPSYTASISTQNEQAFTVRNNKFGKLLESKLHFNTNASIQGNFIDALVYNNLFLGGTPGSEGIFAVPIDSVNAADGQVVNTGMLFYGNTLVDCIDLTASGFPVHHFNNAHRSVGSRMIRNARYQSEAADAFISYSDYNISTTITGLLRDTLGNVDDYSTKATWNAAPASTLLLEANPDSNSFEESPTFTNEGAGDYSLTNANAVSGLGGMPIGATGVVGVLP